MINMRNKLFCGISLFMYRTRALRSVAVAVIAIAAILSFAGCSPKSDANSETVSVTVSNVTLTAAQRQKISLYTVAPSKYHKTTDTTGTVDFDNDQATTILAPFGGPVSRMLVSPAIRLRLGTRSPPWIHPTSPSPSVPIAKPSPPP